MLLAIAAGLGCERPVAKEEAKPPTWEYMVREVKPYKEQRDRFSNLLIVQESELNHFGRFGWELVSAVPETETISAGFPNARTKKITLFFKRPTGVYSKTEEFKNPLDDYQAPKEAAPKDILHPAF